MGLRLRFHGKAKTFYSFAVQIVRTFKSETYSNESGKK